nr:U32 family peptidase [Desulfobulbaceae bacterium]
MLETQPFPETQKPSHLLDKLELLAPAGTIEVFEAAVQSGADAIYIGAPMANARALAKHFSFEEIAALVSFAHKNGVKVYVAMNSLIKNDELGAVVTSLSIFEGIGVDAVIIQDLGIYSIARRYFPRLRLHASTLLGAHNSLAVKKMADMGFARIVLAREMGISEIEAAGGVSRAELEVFVHGAMCFSYSGLCLASSFLGGKSGLRGRCVQPCRRKYSWKGKHKGSPNGYFFSMNDLNGIHFLKAIQEAGVNSLKIEGRMRSLQYIKNVVKAYRLVIDHDSSADSLETAQGYLARAMGRKTSAGFFSLPQQEDIISSHHSGNIGLFMGSISQISGNKAVLDLQADIEVGDRLRIHSEDSGERNSFTVRNIWLAQKPVSSATKQTQVSIEVPASAKSSDPVYKVDTADSRLVAAQPQQVNWQQFKKDIVKEKSRKRIKTITDELSSVVSLPRPTPNRRVDTPQRHMSKGFSRKKDVSHKIDKKLFRPALPLWLKVDSFIQLRKLPRDHFFSRIVVLLTHDSFSQFKRSGVSGLSPKMICWSLPPVIHEANVRFYREAISLLLNKGYCDWQLGHFSQSGFFEDYSRSQGADPLPVSFPGKKIKSRKPRYQKVTYHGNYTLNCINSYSLEELQRQGLRTAQIAIEADRQVVSSLAANGRIEKGVTVYGFPSLLTARASLDVFKTSAELISPKGESFLLKEVEGVTQVISQQPFSLLDYIGELHELGVGYGVVDLTNTAQVRDPLGEVLSRIAGKKRHRRLSTFNYNGTLF